MTDRSASISKYGTSYKRGTLFFPETLSNNTKLLYAFVREADEYVDSNQWDHHQAQKELITMRSAFDCAYSGTPTGRALTDEFAQLCLDYEISNERVHAFFDAMIQDTTPSTYQTYSQLQHYMYGSAQVIGLMMCKLIGYDKMYEEKVFTTAKMLGEAMQFTNFLRDIQEDYEELGRIYIPSDILQKYNLSHTLLKQYIIEKKPVDKERKYFIQHQIDHMKQLYQQANTGIHSLHRQGRFGVYLASKLYEGILDVIIQKNYDVFSQDVHTTPRKKFTIAAKHSFIYLLQYSFKG